uniref:BAR domain-containing protein n=1 Tax=Steinernema glaseri TaxID=37863 RepID=A0A1I7ZHG4_9BILA
MFRRLKQNIKEKTGRATATKLTPEQDQSISYNENSRKQVEEIAKALDQLSQRWRGGGLTPTEEIGDPANVLSGKLPKGKYGAALRVIHEMQTEIGRLERRANDELLQNYVEGTFKAWLKGENQKAHQIINELKTRRVDKDACSSAYTSKATPERQQQMEQANARFEEQLAIADAEFANFPTQQQNHARAIGKMAQMLAKHYDECQKVAEKHAEKVK